MKERKPDKTKKILLDVGDGPEGIQIYTSEEEAVVDWANDLPALYLVASTQDASVKLGPFQLSKGLTLQLEQWLKPREVFTNEEVVELYKNNQKEE